MLSNDFASELAGLPYLMKNVELEKIRPYYELE